MPSRDIRPLEKDSPLRCTVGTAIIFLLSTSSLKAAPSTIECVIFGLSRLIRLSAWTTSGQFWQLKLINDSKWYVPSKFFTCSLTFSSTLGALPQIGRAHV